MAPTPSWRAVADQLAQRMQHHLCNGHPEAGCDEVDPLCRNRSAYRAWKQKREASR
jgi:hypothetical protein